MIYLCIAGVIFAGDFFLKRYIDKTRKLNRQEEILDGKIIVRKYYNEGAILDTLSKWPSVVRMLCGIIMIILGVFWILLLREKGNHGLKLGISLVIGGGMSNLYDRFAKGHVVDYFSFRSRFKRIQRIIFNISDLFIFLGTILILIFRKK